MKPIKLFNKSLSYHYSLAHHVAFQTRSLKLIEAIDPAKILLEPKDIEVWKKSVHLEQDIALEVSTHVETQQLSALHRERTKLTVVLFQNIRVASRSPFSETQEPGLRLKIVVDTYKGIQYTGRIATTTHIESLLLDLDKKQMRQDLTILELGALVELLRNANAEYMRIDAALSSKKAQNKMPRGLDIRAINDRYLFSIFRHIEAAYICTDNDSVRKEIDQLIDEINQIIREIRISNSESRTHRRRNRALRKLAEAVQEETDE